MKNTKVFLSVMPFIQSSVNAGKLLQKLLGVREKWYHWTVSSLLSSVKERIIFRIFYGVRASLLSTLESADSHNTKIHFNTIWRLSHFL
jgi:hypothetical protein